MQKALSTRQLGTLDKLSDHLTQEKRERWYNSLEAAYAAKLELWLRDSHTALAFVTVSIAASIMGRFFMLPPYSLWMW